MFFFSLGWFSHCNSSCAHNMKSGSSLYFQIKSEQETEEVNLRGAVIVNEDSATYSRVFIWEGQWFCTCLGNPTNKTTEFLSEESQFITNENFFSPKLKCNFRGMGSLPRLMEECYKVFASVIWIYQLCTTSM